MGVIPLSVNLHECYNNLVCMRTFVNKCGNIIPNDNNIVTVFEQSNSCLILNSKRRVVMARAYKLINETKWDFFLPSFYG